MNSFKGSTALKITKPVQEKINKALSLLMGKEWSGILFYTMAEEKRQTILTTEDILILDIGSSVHTEWDSEDANVEIAGFVADNGLEHCKMGLIHSHNHMEAFFSGEDTATLRKEGLEKENFLSLIVNDAQEYKARFTTRCTYEPTYKISYPTANGTKVRTVKGKPYADLLYEEVTIHYPFRMRIREDELLSAAYRIQEAKAKKPSFGKWSKKDYKGNPTFGYMDSQDIDFYGHE